MPLIHTAEVLLPCTELQATLDFFIGRLGFRLESIFPADDPATAQLSGHGLRLRLERGRDLSPSQLRLVCADPEALADGQLELRAPNGTRIELVRKSAGLVVPTPHAKYVHTRTGTATDWREGRAGMRYRDLMPDRLGGFLVASHIRVDAGGPVPDYVHYHDVQFQLIYCKRGWVRVLYEDQGPALLLGAGDCVLQPPLIRHRVLECSAGLEVIELCAPSAHETHVDHELVLPNERQMPERDFAGQRFVYHRCAAAIWQPWRQAGFESRDLGIAAATANRVNVEVVRMAAGVLPMRREPLSGFRFVFVLEGMATLARQDGAEDQALQQGDVVLLPGPFGHSFEAPSAGLELLEATFHV